MLEEATKKDATQIRLAGSFSLEDIPSDPNKNEATGNSGM
jgi:hypothetical protein